MGNTLSGPGCSTRLADPGKELLRCAEQGDTRIVSFILACDTHYLAHSSVFGGNTAWHKAAKTGQVEVLEAMERVVAQQFEQSRDVRSCMTRLGSTAREVVKKLINKANLKGTTPLMLACTGCHTDAVAWLIKHGADVWRHDRVRRHTALHCAAQAGATDAIRIILASTGTDVHHNNRKTLIEQGNHAGLTALHYAVYCDQLEVLQQLLAHDADITVQAEFPDLDWGSVNAGDTVMHIAANKGNIDTIQVLLRAYNEKSGTIMPEAGLPRRLRDPRAMRNDYGRLPYHLAMRKGFTWLAELLDPSVPVRYLLAGEQLDTGTTWGPARLATIAASVLHQSLMSDLKAIKALTQAQEEAAAAAAAAVKVQPAAATTAAAASPAAAKPAVLVPAVPAVSVAVAQAIEAAAASSGRQADGDAAAAAAGGDDGSDVPAGQRRRWSLHRRSNSWSSNRAATAAAAGDGSVRPPSRRQGAGSRAAHSRRGSRGTPGEFGPPPSPLSPRVLMSVMLGAAASSSGLELPGLDQCMEPGSLSPKPELTLQLPSLLGVGKGKVEGPLADEDDTPEQQQQQQQQQQQCISRGASGSLYSAVDDGGWDGDDDVLLLPLPVSAQGQEAAAAGPGSAQQQQQVSSSSSNCQADDDGGTVSLLPEALVEGQGGSIMEALLQQLRWRDSSCMSPNAPRCSNDSLGEDSRTCGVCLDSVPNARVVPCSHSMCADCALDMCERFSLGTAVCPFCRCIIRGFAPARLAAAAPQHAHEANE